MRPVGGRAGAILTIALLALVAPVPAPAQAQTLAITGAAVIDGTGKAPVRDGVVLIRDGRIAGVGPAREVSIPAGASRLDARGKYVIPGLMDGVNLAWFPVDLETLIKYEGRYHELFLEAAQIALKSGVTTTVATRRSHAPAMKARDLINAGQVPGSRIFVGGNIIGFDGRFSEDGTPEAGTHVSKAFVARINNEWDQGTGSELLWMRPEEVRSVIREYLQKQKIDYLKYAASDSWGQFITFSPRVQRVIVEEGHRAGLTVQAHTMSVESTDLAIEAGVNILTHGDRSGLTTPFPEETIRKMVERSVFVGVLPQTQRHLDAREMHAPGSAGFSREPRLKVAKTNRRNMIKAGVTMLLGTEAMIRSPEELAASSTLASDTVEASFAGKLGEAHVYALVALEEEGMAPMEILKTATSHVARAYKLDAKLGTLEPGKLADLVILEANPLESARNYGRVHAVIKDGRVVDRDALPVAPLITARALAR